MHDIFSFSHYTKTKVTVLTHNTACPVITIHWHPCIKFLSSLILYHHLPTLSTLVCAGSQTQAGLHMATVQWTQEHQTVSLRLLFSQNPHLTCLLFPPLLTTTQSEAEALQQRVVTGSQGSYDSTKMYRQSIS